jgi:hypothetical protein
MKATEKRSWLVPVLPAIVWPGMAARVPVPMDDATSPMRIWLSVVATAGGMAPGTQVSPVFSGAPSAPVSGAPVRSSTAVTGVGSHCVPLAAIVEYALASASGLVASAPSVNEPRRSAITSSATGSRENNPMRWAMRTGPSTLPSWSSRATKYVLDERTRASTIVSVGGYLPAFWTTYGAPTVPPSFL